ncbi:MAG TPA: FAD/NAD(P)-binding protein, partial [Acidocella sp.]|nr:FAD/NAD(P)-binding protein [Acidocella sp.]
AGLRDSLPRTWPPEAGKDEVPCAVGVIGAGFSGTIATILLRRHLPAAQPVYLIERSGEFARGVAYAESEVPHLLNVRSANMSAFADDPGHFERWLAGEGAQWPEELRRTEAGLFATRRLYGKYLQATLRCELAASGGAVRLLPAEVQALEPRPQGWRLRLAGGGTLMARGVVLATGSLPAGRPCDGAEIRDPWAPEALSGLEPDVPVLIIGTGLTMVDLVLALQAQGFRGPIIALSRRGLVPQAHEQVAQPWLAPDFGEAAHGSVLALLRAVRAELRAASVQNIGWRAVIDSLRPLTAPLWHGLKPQEQARFLRHLRPYWDVHRHRMAPPAAMLIDTLRASGRLRILRGRVREVRCGEGQATVLYDECPGGVRKTLQVQRVIHATGLPSVRESGGLVASMLASGQTRPDGQGLGLEVTAGLALIDANGQPVRHLWALGPIVRGMFWECTAVPDIRQQASVLAQEVAAALSDASAGPNKTIESSAKS